MPEAATNVVASIAPSEVRESIVQAPPAVVTPVLEEQARAAGAAE